MATADMLDGTGARVANTYELLEAILLHIPQYLNGTLILAKATSKSFAAVITRSKNIQKRLLIDLPVDHDSVGIMRWAPKFYETIVTMRYKSSHDRLHARAVIDLERLRNTEDAFHLNSSWRDRWLVRESTKRVTMEKRI
ncbi:hypothetical protein DOTSEDRAFT_26976 [Dothistroma septosporum NZE10]|uniref:Uncharacterized protein n=1 Tax=Dothistroma septosporum (strain NZE10 / CBS 128990) TaxID=675120 RepID=N1PHL3_DOTSN|nr:hypothetical protein DOTSEDRAFT_26976 [Dothistroma septosporum NZE10]